MLCSIGKKHGDFDDSKRDHTRPIVRDAPLGYGRWSKRHRGGRRHGRATPTGKHALGYFSWLANRGVGEVEAVPYGAGPKAPRGARAFLCRGCKVARRWARYGSRPKMAGQIQHHQLEGDEIVLSKGAYLASSGDIAVSVRFGGLRSLFAREGLFMLKLSGHGDVWFSSYGGGRDHRRARQLRRRQRPSGLATKAASASAFGQLAADSSVSLLRGRRLPVTSAGRAGSSFSREMRQHFLDGSRACCHRYVTCRSTSTTDPPTPWRV